MTPNLFIPGFAKCGTTALATALNSHPDIAFPDLANVDWKNPNPKEPRWFSNWANPPKRISQMPGCYPDVRYRLDATPDYIVSPDSIDYLVNHCEQNDIDPKFIIMLRDPVDRIESRWNFVKRVAEEKGRDHVKNWPVNIDQTIDEQVIEELKRGQGSLVFHSLYLNHIHFLLNYFPRESMHFIWMEEMRAKPEVVIYDLLRFLRVGMKALKLQTLNKTEHKEKLSPEMCGNLERIYSAPNRHLQEFLNQ